MNVGDRIKFQFAGKEKEGTVTQVNPKKVYLKVDFPHHPGKVVIRPLAVLEGKAPAPKKKKEKAEKKKEDKPKEEKQEEQA